MLPVFKYLAVASVWFLFITGAAMVILGLVGGIIRGFTTEGWQLIFTLHALGMVSITLSVLITRMIKDY
ncbi:hypothetical protein ACFLTZ_05255 [Chloroflexota bacterium]